MRKLLHASQWLNVLMLTFFMLIGNVSRAGADNYVKYSGDLTEGDYIVYYSGKAMKNTVSSSRLSYSEVTPASDVISNTDEAIIWHIAPSGNYWTLYNAKVDKYAAGTGAANKAQLLASGTDDKALWTVSGSETYEFVNKANASASVNSNLRNNGTYGFACYSSSTGGALTLYKKIESSAVATITTIDNTGITNTDVYTSTAAGVLSATVTANGTAIEGAAITWSSSDENVATVANDGTVTLVAIGTTTITASYAGSTDEYLGSSAEYELIVTTTNPSAPTILWSEDWSTVTNTSNNPSQIINPNATYSGATNSSFYNATLAGGTAPELLLKKNDTWTASVVLNNIEGIITLTYKTNNAKLNISSSTAGVSLSGNTTSKAGGGTVTITGVTPSMTSLKLQFTASDNVRLDDIVLTGFVNSDLPSLSANDVTLAYNATSGEIAYTLTNPVEGTNLTAESSVSWLTVGTPADGTIALTCTANDGAERSATVTLTYGDITKTVTVTQAAAPVVYTTIPALFAAAESTSKNVNVTFGNWVVSGVSGSNVYVTDNNGNGFIIYKSGHGFAVNDKLSGTVSGTPLKLYNGSAEFTDLTASTEGLTVTNDGAITVITDKTIADLGGVNTGAVITLSNLTYDGTNLSDGTNTIKPYYSLYSEMSFTNNKTYNVTGVYLQYSNTKEILPRSADDIEEVENATPYITADNVNIACDATSGTITFTVGNEVSGGVVTAESFASWLAVGTISGTTVPFTCDANTGAARTATVTLTYTYNTNETVTTDVTVTQAVYAIVSTYTLATSIVSGKHYVIASGEETGEPGVVNVMATQKDNNRGATYGTLNDNDLSVSGHAEFVIYGPDANGFYSIYDAEVPGYLYAASSSSNYLRTQADNNDNGLWTISIDETGKATVTAQGNNSHKIMRYNSQSSIFSCYASGQQDIYLYVKDGEATPNVSVTVSDAGFATYCSENALDFSSSEIKAFIGTRNGTSLVFNKINKVPANTGVLLYMPGGKTEDIPVATTVDEVTDNCLVGVNEQTTITADDYILSRSTDGVGFYKAGSHTTLGAHKAYIPSETGNTVKSFAINFGDADGIQSVENGQLTVDSSNVYNLAGQRMSKLQKGVNIVGGKKVMVK